MANKFKKMKISTSNALNPSELGLSINEKIIIDYLYLDLNTCERCVSTDMVLEKVLKIISPAIKVAGFDIIYNRIEMKTEELAIQHRFLSSPTIRVNGEDICLSVKENNCGCCGDIAGTQVNCRVFSYNGKKYEVPPKEMLAQRILKLAFQPQLPSLHIRKYVLPKNLKNFLMYAGRIWSFARFS